MAIRNTAQASRGSEAMSLTPRMRNVRALNNVNAHSQCHHFKDESRVRAWPNPCRKAKPTATSAGTPSSAPASMTRSERLKCEEN